MISPPMILIGVKLTWKAFSQKRSMNESLCHELVKEEFEIYSKHHGKDSI